MTDDAHIAEKDVCPYCGQATLYRPDEWEGAGPLICANPDCDSNHPPGIPGWWPRGTDHE